MSPTRLLTRALAALSIAGTAIAGTARGTAAAQAPDSSVVPRPAPKQVISIQPIGAVLTVYSGEIERAVSRSATVGVGATYFGPSLGDGDFTYLSGDLKLRYYPSGRPLQGFSVGATVGATHVAASAHNSDDRGSTTGASVGTLLEYGWLLGDAKRFYLGLGAGAKALFIGRENFTRDVTVRYPTFRVSVGWGF